MAMAKGTRSDLIAKRCLYGSHPKDNFVNYQLQANMQATDRTLAGLAAHGNGKHRAQGGLGGSTLASVNLQTLGVK
jgi:hypothetical protein